MRHIPAERTLLCKLRIDMQRISVSAQFCERKAFLESQNPLERTFMPQRDFLITPCREFETAGLSGSKRDSFGFQSFFDIADTADARDFGKSEFDFKSAFQF